MNRQCYCNSISLLNTLQDTSMETDDNGHYVPASKPKTKKVKEVVEAMTTEKEHVNVVFIGHVGESYPPWLEAVD